MKKTHKVLDPVRQNMVTSGIQFHPLMCFLGSGYDIFGKYANSKSIKPSIFDWSKSKTFVKKGNYQNYQFPSFVQVIHIGYQGVNKFVGSTALELQASYSESASEMAGVNIGKMGKGGTLFTETAKEEFSIKTLLDINNYFTILQINEQTSKFVFAPLSDEAQSCISDVFKDYIKKVKNGKTKSSQLFRDFGTHFLTSFIIGGRYDYWSYTDKLKFRLSTNFEEFAKEKLKGDLGHESAEESTTSKANLNTFNEATKSGFELVGGSSVTHGELSSAFVSADPNAIKQSLGKWTTSIYNYNDEVIVEFGDSLDTSLIGIWELIDDLDLKIQLKKDAEEYIQNGMVRNSLIGTKIVDVMAVSGETHDAAMKAIPTGWEVINYDVNFRNAGVNGGEYVFVCVVRMRKDEIENSLIKPIHDLKIVTGEEDTNAPEGFTRVETELSKGAKRKPGIGAYTYLCYKKGDTYDGAVRDIAFVGGEENVMGPYGYYTAPSNLNYGTPGEYFNIKICWTNQD